MMEDIRLSIKYESEFDIADPEIVLSFLNEHVDETLSAMNHIVQDDRADIDEGSYKWTEIEYRAERVFASYSFSWTSYYGCDDFNNEDEETGTIEIMLVDNALVLPVFKPWETPTTFEEF
jgi:hypothetical protein